MDAFVVQYEMYTSARRVILKERECHVLGDVDEFDTDHLSICLFVASLRANSG
jgi:hypothetical protein